MRARSAPLALLAAVALAVAIPNLPAGRIPSEDAGVFFYTAQRILEGGAPYRSVWDHKPPLVYLIDALGLLLGGPLGAWCVQLAALVTAAICGYTAMASSFGRRAALVGGVAWLVAAPRLFLEEGRQTSFVELYALPLQFGALLLLARGPASARGWLAIGALGGCAFLLKPTLVGTFLATLLFAVWATRGSPRSSLRAPSLIGAGAAIPVALVALWLGLAGALADGVDQALRYNVIYASFAPPLERIAAIPDGLRLTLPSGLAVVAVIAWLAAVVVPRPRPPLLIVALIAFPLEMALSTSGRDYHYYFLPWLPAMGILAAFAASEIEHRVPVRATTLVLGAAVVLMCVQPLRLAARLAATGDDGVARAVAGYVASNTVAGDPVLIWGSHNEVLLLADRRAPTRYVYQYAPLATRGYQSPARVDELLADLERRPPALILDASADSFVTPPLDRAGFRAWRSPEAQYDWPVDVERVIAFVESRYERSGVEPRTGWPVWRRR